MAITKIEEIYLYVADVPGSAKKNLSVIVALEEAGIPFQKLQYFENADFTELLKGLNTWWKQPYIELPPLTMDNFPFIVYTEVHDDIPARWSPLKYASGEKEIEDLISLYKSINA